MLMRSLLYAPANRPDLFGKFGRWPADLYALDLEDGTPADQRPAARDTLAASVALARGDRSCRIFVRINPVGTSDFGPDLDAALDCGADGIILAKTDCAEDLAQIPTRLPLIAGIESIAGVINARQIARASGVVAIFFGAEDYCAEMGGRRTAAGLEVLYARSEVVLAAKAARITAIDQVVVDFRDDERFLADAAQARDLGYGGKMCIHPQQVALAHQAFSPTAAERVQAQALVEAYEAAQARGQATIDFHGRMVDGPLYKSALAVLAAASESD
ncbi:MAG: CoA ester lyase [Lysobacterales bacterium]